MICPPCRDGGHIGQISGRYEALGMPARLLRAVRRMAVDHHAKCKGGTWCDCQHYVGQAINKQLVKRAT